MHVSKLLLVLSLVASAHAAEAGVLTPAQVEAQKTECFQPFDGLYYWMYDTTSNGPFHCAPGPDKPWSMLSAYRSGGQQRRHWKYTDDGNETACLEDWKYYASDGTTVLATVKGKSTTLGDPQKRLWCALPVYRPGGKVGNQWGYCSCPDVAVLAG